MMQVMRLELAQHHHSKVAYVVAGIFAIAMSLPIFWLDAFTNVFLNQQANLQVLFSLLPWFITVFVPAVAMRSWVSDRRQGTLELLQTLPISNGGFVLGKAAAHAIVLLLCFAASLPLPFLIASMGNLDWGPVFGGYLGACFLALAAIALCQAVTFFSKSQASAFMLGLVALGTATFGLPQGWNLNDLFAPLAKGLLDVHVLTMLSVFSAFFFWLNGALLRYQRSGFQWLSRKWRKDALLLAIAVVSLFVTHSLKVRKDLTEDRLFTLNEASIALVQKLEQPIEIRFFLSEDMPAKLRPVAQYMTSIGEQYAHFGGAKVMVRYIDPDESLDMLAAAERLEIQPTKVNITERGRQEVVNLWFACAVLYGDQKEVFKTMPAVQEFEYEMSGAILRLTQNEKQRVMLTGPRLVYGQNGSYVFDKNANMAGLANALNDIYEVSQHLLEGDVEPTWGDANILIAWGLERWQNAQLKALDAWLAQGKPALIMADGVEVDPLQFTAQAYPESMADAFFEHLGLDVSRHLIADFSNMKVRYTQKKPPVLKDYPLFPVLLPNDEGLKTEVLPALEGLNKVTLAYPSPLTLRENAPNAMRVAAQSSPQSWPHQPEQSIHPEFVPGPTFFERYNVGLYFEGNYRAKWATQTKNVSRFAVFSGSHTLVQSSGIGSRPFVTNMVSYLTRDQALAGINRQENAFRTIQVPLDQHMQRIKWLSVVIPLTCVLLAFLSVSLAYRMRRFETYL